MLVPNDIFTKKHGLNPSGLCLDMSGFPLRLRLITAKSV